MSSNARLSVLPPLPKGKPSPLNNMENEKYASIMKVLNTIHSKTRSSHNAEVCSTLPATIPVPSLTVKHPNKKLIITSPTTNNNKSVDSEEET